MLANKIDDPSRDDLAAEFHSLGFGDPFPLSGLHGTNTGDLLDEILDRLPAEAEWTIPDDEIRVAILGRPNVGKSSLFNKLVGEERTIVSDVPGTTRDAIDTVLVRGGRTYRLVDTAGLRRKRRQRQGIEFYSSSGPWRRRSGPTSRWCCSTRARGSSRATSTRPRSHAGRHARR